MTTAPARLSRLAGGAGGRSATRRRPRPTQSSAPKSTSLVASTAATTAAASTGNPNRARMLAMSKSLERKRLASSRVTAALDSVSATGSVSLPVLKAACACFDPSDWDQVMIERNLADACGYPLCPKALPANTVLTLLAIPPTAPETASDNDSFGSEPTGRSDSQVPADDLAGATDAHTIPKALARQLSSVVWEPLTPLVRVQLPESAELASFCSRVCLLRAKLVRVQLHPEPIWMRPAGLVVDIQFPEDEAPASLAITHAAVAIRPKRGAVIRNADLGQDPPRVPVTITESTTSRPTITSSPYRDAFPDSGTIDGYTPRFRTMPPPRPRQPDPVSPSSLDASALPSVFIQVASAFTGIVRDSFRTRMRLSAADLAPRTLDDEDNEASDDDDEREMQLLDLDRRVAGSAFVIRLDELTKSFLAVALASRPDLVPVVHMQTHAIFTHLRSTRRAQRLTSMDSVYSWVFAAVLVTGALRTHPALAAQVTDHDDWRTAIEHVTGAVLGTTDPIRVDQIEALAKLAFE